MRPIVKLFLKRELHQAKRANDVERVTLIESVIDNGDILDLVGDAVKADMEYKGYAAAGDLGSFFANVLKYMIDHREELLKLLLLISQVLA